MRKQVSFVVVSMFLAVYGGHKKAPVGAFLLRELFDYGVGEPRVGANHV